jgi:hypothetical protein
MSSESPIVQIVGIVGDFFAVIANVCILIMSLVSAISGIIMTLVACIPLIVMGAVIGGIVMLVLAIV